MIHFRRWVNYLYDHFNLYSIVLSNHEHPDLRADKIIVDECINKSRKSWVSSSLKVRSIAHKMKADLVHVHYVPSGFTSLFIDCPLITTVYGGDINEIPFNASIWERLMSRIILRKSDIILADAFDLISIMKDRLKIKTSKMKYFQWGVDLEYFDIKKRTDRYREKFKIPQHKKAILSYRGWAERYNILKILDAFSKLVKERKDVVLVLKNTSIVYNQEYKEIIEKRLMADDLNNNVIKVPDNLPYSELCELLFSCDIYVSVPDVDGTAMSLLESMACGLLPLLSELPAAMEWITDGKNGILCNTSEESLLNAFHRILDLPLETVKKWQEINSKTILEKADERSWMEKAHQMYIEAIHNKNRS